MKKILLFLSLLSLISLISLLLSSCVSEPDPADDWSLPIGSEMPRFEVALTDGSVVLSESLKGKPTMLVFFNTSCSDCREELPVVQRIYDDMKEDINLLCISREQDKVSVREYWKENSLTLPVSAQPNRYIYNLFAKSVIPRIFIFDASGILTAAFSDSPLPNYTDLHTPLTGSIIAKKGS